MALFYKTVTAPTKKKSTKHDAIKALITNRKSTPMLSGVSDVGYDIDVVYRTSSVYAGDTF